MFGFNVIYGNSSSFELDGHKHINYTTIKSKQKISFSYKLFEKFKEDKIFEESDNYIIGVDGVILNLKDLKKQYAISNYFKLIVLLWGRYKQLFPNELKGEFSGFIFDKKSEKLFVFCNQTATKPVYYSRCNNSSIISSTISEIIRYRKNKSLPINLDKDAVYSMFTYAAMFENETLVEEVKRLHAGEFVEVVQNTMTVGVYQNFNDVSVSINRKKQAIDLLEESFSNALDLEYKKDLEYDYKHLATLSGGLDSRMNVMLALEKGYENDVFCFSESGYLDESISKEIARELNLKYKFIPLDGGDYFKNISENVEIGRGTMFYLGSAHLNFALNKIDLNDCGLIHTGQIGDGVLGGFVSGNSENYFSKKVSSKFEDKAARKLAVLDKYASEETFKLLNRVCNLTNSGSFTIENHKSYLVSPFMDVDFINNCLSISPQLKKKGQLYLEWINKYHPELAKYKWERTGFTPTHIWKTELSRYTNKLKFEYYKILKKENRLSMNPVEFWYRNNEEVRLVYESFFKEKIERIKDNTLRKDFTAMFEGNIFEKAMVITVLEFITKNNILI